MDQEQKEQATGAGVAMPEQLLTTLQARTTELAVLNELARELTTARTAWEVAERVYRHAGRLLDVTNFGVATYNPLKDEITFVLQVAGERKTPPDQPERRRARRGLTEYVIHSGQPLWLPDRVQERRAALGLEAFGRGAQCWLGVPLITGDRVLGAIFVQSYTTPNYFSERERELLRTIADQAAPAFESVRLWQERERRITELSILTEIGRTLALVPLPELPEKIREQVGRVFAVDNFFIAYYEEGSDEWEVVLDVEHGVPQPVSRYPSSVGLTGYILRHGRPLLFSTTAQLQAFMRQEGIGQLGELAKSWLGVPLLVGERVLGVIGVQSYEDEYMYTEHELSLLQTIGSQLAAVLENARLLQTAQETATRLQALYTLGRQLAAVNTQEEIIRLVLQAVRELGATDGELLWLEPGERPLFRSTVWDRAALSPAEEQALVQELLTHGIQQVVLAERRTVAVPDTSVEPHWLTLPSAGAPVQAALCVPLFDRSGALSGTLTWLYARPQAFKPAEMALAEEVGARLTIALESARWLEQARQYGRREQRLRELTARVRGSVDPDSIVRLAVRELGTTLGRPIFIQLERGTARRQTAAEPTAPAADAPTSPA